MVLKRSLTSQWHAGKPNSDRDRITSQGYDTTRDTCISQSPPACSMTAFPRRRQTTFPPYSLPTLSHFRHLPRPTSQCFLVSKYVYPKYILSRLQALYMKPHAKRSRTRVIHPLHPTKAFFSIPTRLRATQRIHSRSHSSRSNHGARHLSPRWGKIRETLIARYKHPIHETTRFHQRRAGQHQI